MIDRLKYPLVVAPMAGGPSSVDLVSAASNAGALGSVGAAYSTPSALRDFVAKLRAKTSAPFAINLFLPTPIAEITPSRRSKALAVINGYRREFGLSPVAWTPPFAEDFDAQFETVLELRPAVFSYVFGTLTPSQTERARRKNIFLIGTATSVGEARALRDSECDAITLQGVEAGGHRGVFDATADDPGVGVMELIEQCKVPVDLPLIAAGGLMHAGDVRRAFEAGASAVQMGTAFLACAESGASVPYRRALTRDGVRTTRVTRVFSGRLARGVENRFLTEVEAMGHDAHLPFPAQNALTRDLRKVSAEADSSDFISLWAGTGEGDLWSGSITDFIPTLFE